MNRTLLTLIPLLSCLLSAAQVPVDKSPYRISFISPEYFGPYAFPVPELLEGDISHTVKFELAGDSAIGSLGGSSNKDRTYAATFKACFPLWSERAALSVWGEMHEWYTDTQPVRSARRVSDVYPLCGDCAGNVYFSLDLLLLKEGIKHPSIALRAATQTATGDKYEVARHYDAPGYFFDLSAGKSIKLGNGGSLRGSVTAGFLCWQIDRGKQNDAFMLGAKASYSDRMVSVSFQYGQYNGLETKKDPAAGDCPKAFQVESYLHAGRLSPFVKWQKGIHDWPFSLVRAGVSIDIGHL